MYVVFNVNSTRWADQAACAQRDTQLNLALPYVTTQDRFEMSHIADLHNRGRCGLHQTIDQARHGYAQLIDKELKAADQAHLRRRMLQMGVKCPLCRAPAGSYKCAACGHFPVVLPEVLPPLPGFMKTPEPSERRRRVENRLQALEQTLQNEKSEQLRLLQQIDDVKQLLMSRTSQTSPSRQ